MSEIMRQNKIRVYIYMTILMLIFGLLGSFLS